MQGEDAIRLIAAELDVFHLDADAEGNYATRLPDGTNLRILPRPGDLLILEAQLFTDVTANVRSPESLMALLTGDFARSILCPSVLTYLRDFDEFAISQMLSLQDHDETTLPEVLESFLREARDLSQRIRELFTPSSTLPSNPGPRL